MLTPIHADGPRVCTNKTSATGSNYMYSRHRPARPATAMERGYVLTAHIVHLQNTALPMICRGADQIR